MSWQASKYAREQLETGRYNAGPDRLTPGDRAVLMLLAERAGSDTRKALGGGWLATATGLASSSIRRTINRLAELDVVDVVSSPPRPLAVYFPMSIDNPQPARHGAGSDAVGHPQPARQRAVPAHHGAHTRAPVRAIPHGRVENHSGCDVCGGDGYVEVATDRPSGRAMAPCPARRSA